MPSFDEDELFGYSELMEITARAAGDITRCVCCANRRRNCRVAQSEEDVTNKASGRACGASGKFGPKLSVIHLD